MKIAERNLSKAFGSSSFPHSIREGLLNNLRRTFHLDVVAHTRCRSPHFPCHSGVAVILVIQLMHPNQLLWRHSRSHNLLRLDRTRSSFQLSIRMGHSLFPAFIEEAAEGLDLGVGAAVLLDHAVDLVQLVGVVPRYSQRFLYFSPLIQQPSAPIPSSGGVSMPLSIRHSITA